MITVPDAVRLTVMLVLMLVMMILNNINSFPIFKKVEKHLFHRHFGKMEFPPITFLYVLIYIKV